MQNYKKFMAQVEERISKMNKKPSKSEGGIMSRKDKMAWQSQTTSTPLPLTLPLFARQHRK